MPSVKVTMWSRSGCRGDSSIESDRHTEDGRRPRVTRPRQSPPTQCAIACFTQRSALRTGCHASCGAALSYSFGPVTITKAPSPSTSRTECFCITGACSCRARLFDRAELVQW